MLCLFYFSSTPPQPNSPQFITLRLASASCNAATAGSGQGPPCGVACMKGAKQNTKSVLLLSQASNPFKPPEILSHKNLTALYPSRTPYLDKQGLAEIGRGRRLCRRGQVEGQEEVRACLLQADVHEVDAHRLQWRVGRVDFGDTLCAYEAIRGVGGQVRGYAGAAHVRLKLDGCGPGFVVLGEVLEEMGGSLFFGCRKEYWRITLHVGGDAIARR